jgi:hypothetical protein
VGHGAGANALTGGGQLLQLLWPQHLQPAIEAAMAIMPPKSNLRVNIFASPQ